MEKYNLIKIDRDGKEHLYNQLADVLKMKIREGIFLENEKMLPIRKLAGILGVNNITVVNAYKILEDDGYVYKKVGSGTFVIPRMNSDVKSMGDGEIDLEFKLMDSGQVSISEDSINLASSTPTAELFPVNEFKAVLNEVLDRDKGLAFGYQEVKGYYPLRESIYGYLLGEGIDKSIESIQVISGAQQGIDIVSKAILDYGDTVIVESPTYTGAVATFKSRGVNIVTIEMEVDGVSIDKLEKLIEKYSPKLFFTMTNFQNPTGRSYSQEKKRRLLELAHQHKFYILEDDYASELNFSKTEIHTLKSRDYYDVCIYIKSFSKIFMPGLRLGFMVVPELLFDKIVTAKHSSDISTSGLLQRSFDLYLRGGMWENHLKEMRGIYCERHKTMMMALKKYMPEAIRYDVPKGGLNFWLEVPKEIGVKDIYSEALKNNVLIVLGEIFYADEKKSNTIRLSIAAARSHEIIEGVKRISSIVEKLLIKSSRAKGEKKYMPIL